MFTAKLDVFGVRARVDADGNGVLASIMRIPRPVARPSPVPAAPLKPSPAPERPTMEGSAFGEFERADFGFTAPRWTPLHEGDQPDP